MSRWLRMLAMVVVGSLSWLTAGNNIAANPLADAEQRFILSSFLA
jgi:hypothetical protein